jgi:hypothetical protein
MNTLAVLERMHASALELCPNPSDFVMWGKRFTTSGTNFSYAVHVAIAAAASYPLVTLLYLRRAAWFASIAVTFATGREKVSRSAAIAIGISTSPYGCKFPAVAKSCGPITSNTWTF